MTAGILLTPTTANREDAKNLWIFAADILVGCNANVLMIKMADVRTKTKSSVKDARLASSSRTVT